MLIYFTFSVKKSQTTILPSSIKADSPLDTFGNESNVVFPLVDFSGLVEVFSCSSRRFVIKIT